MPEVEGPATGVTYKIYYKRHRAYVQRPEYLT